MANTAAAYDAALPDDPAVRRKTMFGLPCAFVDRQMFFGTFGDGWVARVGPDRVAALARQPGKTVFTPTEGRAWDDYVFLAAPIDEVELAAFAAEALAWTRALAARPSAGRKPFAVKVKGKKAGRG